MRSEHSESAREQRIALYKSNNNNDDKCVVAEEGRGG